MKGEGEGGVGGGGSCYHELFREFIIDIISSV